MEEYAHTGKWQKKHTWKMREQKMHDKENGRTENQQHGKWQKIHILKNDKKAHFQMTEQKIAEQKMAERKMAEWKMPDMEIGRTDNA